MAILDANPFDDTQATIRKRMKAVQSALTGVFRDPAETPAPANATQADSLAALELHYAYYRRD